MSAGAAFRLHIGPAGFFLVIFPLFTLQSVKGFLPKLREEGSSVIVSPVLRPSLSCHQTLDKMEKFSDLIPSFCIFEMTSQFVLGKWIGHSPSKPSSFQYLDKCCQRIPQRGALFSRGLDGRLLPSVGFFSHSLSGRAERALTPKFAAQSEPSRHPRGSQSSVDVPVLHRLDISGALAVRLQATKDLPKRLASQ